jgi:hypothetical protein
MRTKQIILVLLISLSLFSCIPTDKTGEINIDRKIYIITVDDGNGDGILSITNYNAIEYLVYKSGGIEFTTTDGKEHYTTYDFSIREK